LRFFVVLLGRTPQNDINKEPQSIMIDDGEIQGCSRPNWTSLLASASICR